MSISDRPVSFIANVGYETWSAEAVVDSLTAAGYDSVEWTMDHVDSLLPPASALACQQDFVSSGPTAVELSLRAVEAAAEAGIGIVNVVTGPNLWEPGASLDGSSEAAWSQALFGLETICDRAAELQVKIGFEPCWGTLAHDAATAERVLSAVPVSVCFDPSHFVMTGDDILALIEKWGERIVHFHLKDAFGRPGMDGEDFHFCMLGEGLIPWPDVFAALESTGYQGALSVEFEAYNYLEQVLGSAPERAAKLAREQVTALLANTAGVEQ